MLQNVLTDRLSLAIFPKFPQGDILGTTLVTKAWDIFVSWTVDNPKKFSTQGEKMTATRGKLKRKKSSLHLEKRALIKGGKGPLHWRP